MGVTIVRGTNDKPAASQALVETFAGMPDMEGQLFIGYPIIGAADGRHPIDAVLVSPSKGVVVFDLVEGRDLGSFEDRQDEVATRLQQRLLGHRELVVRRNLVVGISSITFAPAVQAELDPQGDYPVANQRVLHDALEAVEWGQASNELYERTLSAVQSISTIRRSRTARNIQRAESRGAKLQKLENSIATLDMLQSKAVIETVDGVQRIRGLAGSGKTIVLALKAAYLHAQHPDWRIAVTFSTRSLKAQLKRLINSFSIENSGEEPNWDNVRIINSWGAPGGGDRDGLYYEYCARNGVPYLDFRAAQAKFGRQDSFRGACGAALREVQFPEKLYDAILVDEAQDLPVDFLRLCYTMLDESRRLVYAYDELQTLDGAGLPSVEEIFGHDAQGRPRVSFDSRGTERGARRDIILEKCYRNSRPVLVSAHGLGFGVYRKPSRSDALGLVQMFDEPKLWAEIGYEVTNGKLESGSSVTLERTEESSPKFLEDHSSIDDLIAFIKFDTKEHQDQWVANQIQSNLVEDELRYDDIVVINTNPLTTRGNLGPVRKELLARRIQSHLAGVDTNADVFFTPGSESITFTGIHRAKGNEAGMVYIVNAEECQSSNYNLAQVRNRLFTAMTRSKAWVRVLGVGPMMDELIGEYRRIKDSGFELSFTYPTPAQREKIQVIHRDMTAKEEQLRDQRQASVESLLSDFEKGVLFPDDLDPDVMERLRRYLGGSDA